MKADRTVIVIPVYDPDEHLVELVEKLNSTFKEYDLVMVNDGSTIGIEFFEACKKFSNVTLLNHEKNLGKGCALKTAFKYIKANYENCVIVTADSDGQHKVEDIKRVYYYSLDNRGALVLGSRKFDCKVPKKSTIGNDVTRNLLRFCLNTYIHDNQTGLRAFGYDLLDFMISIKGSRYEYEMNVINECVRSGIPIRELAVQTVYIRNNKATHFRPVRDFARIVLTIIKYSLPILIAFAVNIVEAVFVDKWIETPVLVDSAIIFISTILVFFILNLTGLCYGDKKIFKKKDKLLRLNLYFAVWIILFDSIYYFFRSYIITVVFADILALAFSRLINFLFVEKIPLYE